MVSDTLLMSIRESFGRVVYTHKTHEKQIELLTRSLSIARWMEAILISLTAGGAITVLFGTGFWVQFITAILASAATTVTIYQLSFDPYHVIRDHRKCARHLWLIREKYINLLADLIDGAIDEEEGRGRRDGLLKELQQVYMDAPDTSAKAYSIAQVALKIKEEMTFSDEEIDKFLPKPLKKIA
jgi:hypothetical protein